MYYVKAAERHVFIVTYGCHPIGHTRPVLSHEHREIGLFGEDEVSSLSMPDGYRRSISTWYARLRRSVQGEGQ
ncbi:NUDIX hydrolase [Actinophytocola sediminis]